MGVTIFYKGKLDDLKKLPQLKEELSDIAEWMGWKATRVEDDKPPTGQAPHFARDGDGLEVEGDLGLQGIVLDPGEGCESLAFLFDRKGNLRSAFAMMMIAEGTMGPEYESIFCKTQFAGAETHIRIVGVLKYVAKRFIRNLDVKDDSGYWDTGDRAELERRIGFINDQLDRLERKLTSPRVADYANATADELVELIAQLFQENVDASKRERRR